MAKETVGARVPQAIAEQVKAYAQTHDISRTEAIGLFICVGASEADCLGDGRAYTVRIRDVERARDRPLNAGGWKAELRKADREVGEFGSTEALTARLPGEVVQHVAEYAAENGVPKSVAAEDLLIRGLKADPLPDGSEDPVPEHTDYSGAEVKTVELDAEEAELFRRCRLRYKKGPSECVNWLIGATYSTSNAKIGWEKPEDE